MNNSENNRGIPQFPILKEGKFYPPNLPALDEDGNGIPDFHKEESPSSTPHRFPILRAPSRDEEKPPREVVMSILDDIKEQINNFNRILELKTEEKEEVLTQLTNSIQSGKIHTVSQNAVSNLQWKWEKLIKNLLWILDEGACHNADIRIKAILQQVSDNLSHQRRYNGIDSCPCLEYNRMSYSLQNSVSHALSYHKSLKNNPHKRKYKGKKGSPFFDLKGRIPTSERFREYRAGRNRILISEDSDTVYVSFDHYNDKYKKVLDIPNS